MRETSKSDISSHPPADRQLAGKRTSGLPTPVEKRIAYLTAQLKTKDGQLRDAEGAARYWSGVAFEVVRSLLELAPDAAAEVHRRAFITGCSVLAEDPAEVERLVRTLGRLDPGAAAYVYTDLARGPSVLVTLMNDTERLEALIRQSPTVQAAELGKLIADAAARHQHVNRAPAAVVNK